MLSTILALALIRANEMDTLAKALQDSLSPDPGARRAAERELDILKQSPGFSQLTLQLAQSEQLESGLEIGSAIRQAAALLFKNFVRAGWDKVGH